MAYTDSLRRGVLFAAGLALGCQQLPSSSDEFGDGADDDGGSSSFGNDEDDDDDDADDDDADETTEDDDGGSDDGNPTLECDPVDQTGCSEGEKCTVTDQGGQLQYVCVADDQDLDPYSQCTPALGTGIDGCPAGHACFADEMDNGLCVPLCLETGDCSNGNGLCIAPATTTATYCADQCSPFDAGCIPPMQCRRASDRFVCEFGRNGDTGVELDPCALAGDEGCAEGYVCLPGELVPDCTSGSCCTRLCDASASDTCASPAICAPVLEAPAPGNESIGACFVPA
jgi:hypothetical protein